MQDAAYNSLLRRRRQELHGRIAGVMEERFPNIEATEPELLAQHYTEAKELQKAIPLWQKAGSLALKRLALTEAIAHLNTALELVVSLPPSVERDGREVDLRILLGTAWIALRGWAVQEVWDTCIRRWDWRIRCVVTTPCCPYYGDCTSTCCAAGGMPSRCAGSTQIQDAAEAYHDPDLLILGHYAAMNSYFWLGELLKAREHANRVLALYTEERHGNLLEVLNHALERKHPCF